jgi:hypothetical protein
VNSLVEAVQHEAEILRTLVRPIARPIQAILVQHGKTYQTAPLPNRFQAGIPKQCFDNAAKLVLRCRRKPQLVYVEGYVQLNEIPIPIHHGWCVEEGSDAVIDVTLQAPGAYYYGVAFRRDYVKFHRSMSDNTSLFNDWERRWPLEQMPEELLQTTFYKENDSAVHDVLSRRNHHAQWKTHWERVVV